LRKNYERKVKLYFDNDRVPFQKWFFDK
jgi:hypothetical protein